MIKAILRCFACLGFLFFAVPVVQAQSIQDGCWTILKYDKSGKVTGAIKGGNCRAPKLGQLARLTDPDQIEPINNEYILLSSSGIDMSVLEVPNVTILSVEEFPLLGFLGVYIKLDDNAQYKPLRSQVIRRMPGAMLVPNDQYVSQTSKSAWPEGAAPSEEFARSCGKGLKVGMIDGYLDPKLDNLRSAKLVSKSFHRKGTRPAIRDHATVVGEMLIGQGHDGKILGLIPSAQLFAANIFGQDDDGVRSSLLNLMKAVHWLVEKDVRVINFGFAGRFNDGLAFVIDQLSKQGIIVVAPAGNFGTKAGPAWPAAHKDAIAVTAVTRRNQRFSDANTGSYIDVSALGVDVVVDTSDGRRIVRGTSFATPFVTAVSALMIGDKKGVSPTRLRKALSQLSRDLGDPGKDDEFGWGLVRYKPKC